MKSRRRARRVVFTPEAYQGVQRGINQMAEAVRPTLGPRPHMVAVDRRIPGKAPELFDNGGLIARRIVALPDRDADMGAMLMRSLLWRLHERFGDGTTTAAVLFQWVYNQGVRHIVAGGSAMRLRHYLEKGLEVCLARLSGQVIPVSGREQLARIAASLCYDPPLAKMLGEILDVIGEYGQLDIRDGPGRQLEREYAEGSYWKGGTLSHRITDRAERKVSLENTAVLITDLDIEDPRELLAVRDMAKQTQAQSLLITAHRFSDKVLGVLTTANEPAPKFPTVVVKVPGLTLEEQVGAIDDLIVLTGGRPRLRVAGQSLSGVRPDDFGQTRRAWADRHSFGVVGGKGHPRELRRHILQLKASFKNAEDPQLRDLLQQRIGKLMGGSATLWVGGATEAEITVRKELAQRTDAALRGAMLEGVLPGGGVALLACRPALQRMLDQSADPDERAAYRILLEALEEPTRTIIRNAGGDPGPIMAEIKLAGTSYGYDVISGRVVNMALANIFDVATAQKAAVHGAIATAALALTIDVLIHHKRPQIAYTP